MKLYRQTLTPARAKKLIALAKALGIVDIANANAGQPLYRQTPRTSRDGSFILRIAIYCTEEQYDQLAALYKPQA